MGKKVTIRDIAKMAGVSVTTVSQVLNGKGKRFSKSTRERIIKLRDQYQYVPDFHARSLIMKENINTIGVLVPNVSEPFFGTFVEGVQQVARQEKLIPLIFSANRDPKLEKQYLEQMVERSIDGLIIASARMTTEMINQALINRDIPYILFDRNYDQEGARVQTDDYHGGQLAAKHLVELGHQRCLYLGVTNITENFKQRLAGFTSVLQAHGRHFDEASDVLRADLSRRGGYQAAQAVVDSGATSVFAANDDMAIGLLRGLRELKIRVPEDISVVGYDDIALDEYVYPQLTTIHQPIFDLGIGATKILLDRIHNQHRDETVEKFPVRLIRRESTGPCHMV